MLVDSHCHLDRLDLSPFEGNLSLAIEAARQNDVKYLLCVCIDLENFAAVLKIAETYPNVFASLGIHPTEKLAEEPSVEDLVKLASHPKVIAIGETGLDYYREGDKEIQQERFRRHIRVAKKLDKPLIVHTREAKADTINLLKEEGADEVRGVLHCFTEDFAMAQQAMALNFYISFSGIVTFQNAKSLQAVATQLPLDRLLVETDAPYLTPVPFRGKPNQPAYVRYVAEFIAKLRQVDYELVAKHTSQNFADLFKVRIN